MIKISFTSDFYEEQAPDALRHIDLSMQRGLPSVTKMTPPNGRTMAIVGAGPSLENTVGELRGKDWYIMSVNASHDYLIERGIQPDGWAFIEVAPWDAPLCRLQSEKCTYYVASQCAPPIFEHLAGRNICLWHLWQDIGEQDVLAKYEEKSLLIGGGSTPTLRAINLGMAMGYYDFQIFGLDGSFLDKSHANMADGEQRSDWVLEGEFDVTCAGRTFRTKPYLARQAHDFDLFCRKHHHLFSMKVHGDGLIPHIHKTLMEKAYV